MEIALLPDTPGSAGYPIAPPVANSWTPPICRATFRQLQQISVAADGDATPRI